VNLSTEDYLKEIVLKVTDLDPTLASTEILIKSELCPHGAIKIILYAPHVLLNNTDINLTYQCDKLRMLGGSRAT
jgi:hypothetical protein